ncbi:E3 ubiquitin-protein ligase RFWD3 [Artemisia annua]|uniref:E3 ubiquitin-protein ligase RFWD3 n=1 Tax=Artemisia annua TaxID=35608 RepID=A0A2U1KR90_ARTAN|nr:E3 ubiquitin-protein ligase RFWD3 [Artemisia annua]
MDVKDHNSIETEEDTEDIMELELEEVVDEEEELDCEHCLPCGHMYGFSCIETWLKTRPSGSGKCPQCSTACTLKDVDLSMQLAFTFLMNCPSTRRFPYSLAGVKAYRDYESGQLLHASNKRSIDLKRRADVLGKQKVAMKRLTELLNLKAHTEKQAKSLEQRVDAMGRADALRCRADALGQWADEYLQAWLKTGRPGSVKCPQCSTACTLKDVRLINATRLHIPDAAASDQNVADEKSSTRRFPYNSAGVKAYRDYESGQLLHASNKRSIDLKRRADVLGKQKVAMKRLTELLNLKAHTEKQAKSLEQRVDAMGRADALRCRADALGQWADEYLRKADALRCRADALGQWADEYLRKADAFGRRAKALFQRLEKFDESILFLDNA